MLIPQQFGKLKSIKISFMHFYHSFLNKAKTIIMVMLIIFINYLLSVLVLDSKKQVYVKYNQLLLQICYISPVVFVINQSVNWLFRCIVTNVAYN